MLEAFGRTIYRHAKLTLILALAFLAAAAVVLARGGTLKSASIANVEAERAEALVAEVLGHPADTTFVAVFRDPELDARDGKFQESMQRSLAELRDDPRVLSVEGPDDAPPFKSPSMVSGAARAAVAFVTLRGDFQRALEAYPAVRARLRSERMSITCTGRLPYTDDLNRTLERDLVRAELLSLPLALLVLLYVFRTVAGAILPVGVGGLAVVGGVAIVLGVSHRMDITQYTINVCSLIGLGVAIDYSLFTVSRYREELAAGKSYEDALARSMATAGRSVLFSGFAVATGLGGLLFYEGSYLFALGVAGAIVVALAVVFALTFLPALLAVLGPRIDFGRLPFAPRTAGDRWARMARAVMRHPLLVLVPTIAALGWMGAPFARLRLAAADVRILGAGVEARRGYDALRADFADLAANRLTVAVRFPSAPALTVQRIGALHDLSRHVATLPGVLKVESIVDGDPPLAKEDYETALLDPPPMYAYLVAAAKKVSVGERVVLLYVLARDAPDSEEARALVRAIRERRAVGDGALLVGGQTATDVDQTGFILSRTPRAVAFVVTVTLVVLFLLFGSVVLPLKAVAMNVASIAGSFGALVWIFQEAHLFVHEARPLEPALPVLLFCGLFGLSMDYEVLMLSRIKEAWERTHDNTAAVAEGLEKSAGLITSGAAIMVVVFLAFALASAVVLQAMGVGMAIAVALDATIVRVLLVPATMRLFGDANWWAPRPLARLRERLGFRSGRLG